jgi:hypothetical protein
MRYVRICVDGNGETHFADAELEMEEADYRPPAPLMFVSHAHESSAIQFVRLPAGWVGESIRVPERQFFICVEGGLKVTVSDGETRSFGAGNVVFMEDTSGKGHTTRVNGARDCIAAIAPVID